MIIKVIQASDYDQTKVWGISWIFDERIKAFEINLGKKSLQFIFKQFVFKQMPRMEFDFDSINGKLKPCPFCGDVPEAPTECWGTQYEIECQCGLSSVSVQISDFMCDAERQNNNFSDLNKSLINILRARKAAIIMWNKRQGGKNGKRIY